MLCMHLKRCIASAVAAGFEHLGTAYPFGQMQMQMHVLRFGLQQQRLSVGRLKNMRGPRLLNPVFGFVL